MISPILPPVIISDAITSVYIVIAVWMPVTVVPTSFATVAIDTFMTDESRIITNWAAASVTSTAFAALAWVVSVTVVSPAVTAPTRISLVILTLGVAKHRDHGAGQRAPPADGRLCLVPGNPRRAELGIGLVALGANVAPRFLPAGGRFATNL